MSTPWAVITGSSGGLGKEFAHRLAQQGSNVMLVARSHDKLVHVRDEISSRWNVDATIRVCDLSDAAQRAELIEELHNSHVHTLVNNAGRGSIGSFTSFDPSRLTSEIELNVTAVTELTRAVLPQMINRDRGAIINVASTAAFQPVPQMAVYAASKSYVLSLSVALWSEYQDTGVRVVCVAPGPTDTSFFDNAGNEDVMRNRRTVDSVVDSTFKALQARRPYVVDGAVNTALAHATRFVPTRMASRLARYIASH